MRPSMHFALLVLVVTCATTASCVPASAPSQAGAIGFRTEPSPATRGEPFVTDDGWTVTVATLALHMSLAANEVDTGREPGFEEYRFLASESAELFVRDVAVGPADVLLHFAWAYIGESTNAVHDDDTSNVAVPPEVLARFRRSAQVRHEIGGLGGWGPALVLVVRAEKAERVIAIDVTVGNLMSSGEWSAAGNVRSDALAATLIRVKAEALFIAESAPGRLVFDEFAAADRNGDGNVDAVELQETPICSALECPGERHLSDELARRARGLFELVCDPTCGDGPELDRGDGRRAASFGRRGP